MMQVVYLVGSSSVYLAVDTWCYLLLGTELFTDCSLPPKVNAYRRGGSDGAIAG